MRGTLLGNYRVVDRLGDGGTGVVYVGRHEKLGHRVVVKILRPELSIHVDMVQCFFQEAQVATAIRNPGIAQVFDFGATDDGCAYLVMELLEGDSLAARLKQRRLDHGECCRLGRQIANVLQAAHAAGIIHRDLKPDNLFLVPDTEVVGGERVKVRDFGIAKLADDARVAGICVDRPTVTPTYLSPEQCRSADSADARSDIYALGCILFEMACGRSPFVDGTGDDIIAAHLHTPPPHPRHLAPDLPVQLSTLIVKMLDKQPSLRPQTMTVVCHKLDEVLRMLDAASVRPPATMPLLSPASRRPAATPPTGSPVVPRFARDGSPPSVAPAPNGQHSPSGDESCMDQESHGYAAYSVHPADSSELPLPPAARLSPPPAAPPVVAPPASPRPGASIASGLQAITAAVRPALSVMRHVVPARRPASRPPSETEPTRPSALSPLAFAPAAALRSPSQPPPTPAIEARFIGAAASSHGFHESTTRRITAAMMLFTPRTATQRWSLAIGAVLAVGAAGAVGVVLATDHPGAPPDHVGSPSHPAAPVPRAAASTTAAPSASAPAPAASASRTASPPIAASPRPSATTSASSSPAATADQLAARCRDLQLARKWPELARCADELKPLDPEHAKLLATRAFEEARSAPHIAAVQAAMHDNRLRRAKTELNLIWTGSVDFPDLKRTYERAEAQEIDVLATQLDSVLDASCDAYHQLLSQQSALDPPRVVAEAVRRVPCTVPVTEGALNAR